jgi:transposase
MHPGSHIEAVYLCREPVDFRKSINGLSALVQSQFGANPFGSSLHVFISRRRD